MSSGETNINGKESDFAAQMKTLINNKYNSDIKFVVGSKKEVFYAHRCILAARCPVFKAMFTDQNQKNDNADPKIPLVLSDTDPNIFRVMIEFIYTNCATLSNKTAIDVLATSLEYGLDDLKRLCVDFMVANLSTANACHTMQAGVTYRQDDLRQKTMRYIEKHTQEVFESQGFPELSEESLILILQSSRLNMDELNIFHTIRDWAKVNAAVLSKPVYEIAARIISHIRFALLSPEELSRIEDENQKEKLFSVDAISYAWKFHALKKAEKGNPLTTRRQGTLPRESHKYLEIS